MIALKADQMKFTITLPQWIIERLFPGLIQASETHETASRSRRFWGGLIEITGKIVK